MQTTQPTPEDLTDRQKALLLKRLASRIQPGRTVRETFSPEQIADIAAEVIKSDKARLGRLAKRYGYRLEKSRVRTPHLNDQGGFRLTDPTRNVVIAGERFDWTLDDVAGFLAEQAA